MERAGLRDPDLRQYWSYEKLQDRHHHHQDGKGWFPGVLERIALAPGTPYFPYRQISPTAKRTVLSPQTKRSENVFCLIPEK